LSSYSKFFMADGQFDASILLGTTEGIAVNIPENVPFARAQVKRIDWGIASEGERSYWALWQGDRDIAAVDPGNTADIIRSSDLAVFPLASGISVSGPNASIMEHFTQSPRGLYINDEQKIALCVDPTIGAGHLTFYLSIMFMGLS